MSFAGQTDFPAEVVGFAPVDGRIGARGDAVGQRSAPLRPAIRGRGGGADGHLIGPRGKGAETSEEDQARRKRHADALCTFEAGSVKGGTASPSPATLKPKNSNLQKLLAPKA